MNIKCNIKTLFNGLAPVRDKYPKQAYAKKVGLDIYYEDCVITIPFEDLRNYVMKSKKPTKDLYSKEWHYLIYYKWSKIDSRYQPSLFN